MVIHMVMMTKMADQKLYCQITNIKKKELSTQNKN